MSLAVAVILVLGCGALVTSVLFLRSGFERFVAFRYLLRSRPSTAARAGLFITGTITALGLVTLFASRGHSRGLETVGVMATLLGAMLMLLFLLLRFFSVFTTVSTMGVVLGVGSLVVVLAVTSGFEREFEDKVLAVNAHLLVMSYGEPTMEERERAADEYLRKLAGLPGVRKMSKFSMSAGEVMIGKVGANLKGIDFGSGAEELRGPLVAGKVEDLGKPARCPGGAHEELAGELAGNKAPWVGRIALGAELAHRLR